MFLTNERDNPYSELSEEDPKAKKKRKKEDQKKVKKDEKPTSLVKHSTLVYQTQFGFMSEDGFDKFGYGLIFSAVKPLPKFSEKYKGVYVQGDFLYTMKDMKNSKNGATKDYLALTGFGGYAYDLNEKTALTIRGGGSFVTGSGKFEVAYGLGFKREMKNKKFKLIGDYLILGDLMLFSLGAEFSF